MSMKARTTISIDADLLDAFDEYYKQKGYQSRSDCIQTLVSEAIASADDVVTVKLQRPYAHALDKAVREAVRGSSRKSSRKEGGDGTHGN